MLRVGLTGGIGSGKSTVSALLNERGAVIIDYDVLARKIVEPHTDALAAIVEKFGEHVLAQDGTLDRPALGAIVFADEAARRQLEAITHAGIIEQAAGLEAATPADAIVVHDNPLLIEMGGHHYVDVVVVVSAPVELQVARIVANRALNESDARARIGAQASNETRVEAADLVIDNSGTIEQLTAQVDQVWQELQNRRIAFSARAE